MLVHAKCCFWVSLLDVGVIFVWNIFEYWRTAFEMGQGRYASLIPILLLILLSCGYSCVLVVSRTLMYANGNLLSYEYLHNYHYCHMGIAL